MKHSRRPLAGFSLVEALMGLALLAILVSAAMPNFARLRANALVRAEADRFRETLLRARETAVVLGRQIVVCPSPDGLACEVEAPWHRGWIAFEDHDLDRRPDESEPVLDRGEAATPEVLIESSRARRRLRFAPSGMAFGSNATIQVCHRAGLVPGKRLVLSGTGRLRVDRRAAAC